MKTNRVKWDEAMAERCLDRCRAVLPSKTHKVVPAGTVQIAEKPAAAGHWAEFEEALKKALKE